MKMKILAFMLALSLCLLGGCKRGRNSSESSDDSKGEGTATTTASGQKGQASPGLPNGGTTNFDKTPPTNSLTYGNSPIKNEGYDGAMFKDLNAVYYVNAASVLTNAGGIESEKGYDELKFIVALQGLLNRMRPIIFIEAISQNGKGILKDEANFDVDRFWFDYLKTKNYMGNDKADYNEIQINSLDELLTQKPIADFIKQQGYVVWDKEVPATSNVVSTVCGIDGYLPVLGGGTVLERIKTLGAVEKLNLVGRFTASGKIWGTGRNSTGSKKSDAYIWALEKYGDKVNSGKVGYLLDSYAMNPSSPIARQAFTQGLMYSTNGVVNHDYFIMNRSFVFDLSPFSNEIPLDDSGYGRTEKDTDFKTFKEILLKLYHRNNGEIGVVSGFTPWSIKYTTHTNEREEVSGLDGETHFVALCNSYNFLGDADAPSMASLSSASFYSHVQLAEGYSNPKPERIEFEDGKKYVHIYMGDYDGAAWTNRYAAKYFKHSEDETYRAAGDKITDFRSNEKVTWTFNPNLSVRLPHVFSYLMENRTTNDYFICGNSGAGYAFPDILSGDSDVRQILSGLPDGMEAFTRWNEYFYGKFSLDTTGFLLSHNLVLEDGKWRNVDYTKKVMDSFAKFSPKGIFGNKLPQTDFVKYGNNSATYKTDEASMPVTVLQGDLYGGSNNTAKYGQMIVDKVQTTRAKNQDKVFAFRSIITSPRDIKLIKDYVTARDPDVVFVDAYNFFEMYQEYYK